LRNVEIPGIVERFLFHEQRQKHKPIGSFVAVSDVSRVPGTVSRERRKAAINIVIIVQCDADLLEVALALSPPIRLACLLHGWQQKSNQDAMIAMTTSSSMSVNARREVVIVWNLRV